MSDYYNQTPEQRRQLRAQRNLRILSTSSCW